MTLGSRIPTLANCLFPTPADMTNFFTGPLLNSEYSHARCLLESSLAFTTFAPLALMVSLRSHANVFPYFLHSFLLARENMEIMMDAEIGSLLASTSLKCGYKPARRRASW